MNQHERYTRLGIGKTPVQVGNHLGNIGLPVFMIVKGMGWKQEIMSK